MTVNKKYALLMYHYLLETLLEEEQDELYLYVLTALNTGLRGCDLINLTWEQYGSDKFTNVHLKKESSTYGDEVYEDVKILRPIEYLNRINSLEFNRVGAMFNYKNKLAITPLLRRHTGAMLHSHDLRMFWSQLLEF